MQAMLKCCTTTAGSKHNGIVVDAHILRVHDFIGRSLFKHTVLVYATRMGKGIAPDDGLVGLHRHVHQARHHATDREYLCCVDVGLDIEIGMGLQSHHHFLQTGVTSTLTNTIDGHLHLSGTIQHTSHGVGSSHAEVVVTMGRKDGFTRGESIYMLHQVFNLIAILVGQTETCRIGNVHHRGTSLHNSLHHASQILIIRTACIFGIEFHILNILLRILYSGYGTFDDFLWSGVKLISNVALAGTDTSMDALVLGILQGLGCHIDVLLHSTG